MKTNLLCLLIFALGFTMSCKNDDDLPKATEIQGTWDLVNISGGFAGVNCDYSPGEITWTFENNQLTVEDNYTGDTTQICGSGLSLLSGPYSILESNGDLFLVLEGQEAGGITIAGDVLTIDTNVYSTGSGADGFVYRLEK